MATNASDAKAITLPSVWVDPDLLSKTAYSMGPTDFLLIAETIPAIPATVSRVSEPGEIAPGSWDVWEASVTASVGDPITYIVPNYVQIRSEDYQNLKDKAAQVDGIGELLGDNWKDDPSLGYNTPLGLLQHVRDYIASLVTVGNPDMSQELKDNLTCTNSEGIISLLDRLEHRLGFLEMRNENLFAALQRTDGAYLSKIKTTGTCTPAPKVVDLSDQVSKAMNAENPWFVSAGLLRGMIDEPIELGLKPTSRPGTHVQALPEPIELVPFTLTFTEDDAVKETLRLWKQFAGIADDAVGVPDPKPAKVLKVWNGFDVPHKGAR